MRPYRLRQTGLLIALVATIVRGSLAADAPRPSAQCLPDETVLVARIPGGRAFLDALRERTRLGAVLLSAERFERAMKIVREEAGPDWEEFVKQLETYQLKPDDLPRLFDGKLGFGLVALARGEKTPLFIGLTWAEPGGDLSDRIFAAVQKAIEDQKGQEHAATRVDLELAGHKVMHLTIPEVGSSVNFDDLTPAGDANNEEELKNLGERIRQRAAAAKQIEVDQTHVLLARIGNRILMANTFPQSSAEVRVLLKDSGKKVDIAAITGAEETRNVFARFLSAHAESGSGGMIARVMATPGLSASLPSGLPMFEVLADPQPLVKLLAGSDPTVARVLKSLAVDRIGPLALRSSLDGGVLRTGLFASAPQPRAGLLAILDQPAAAPEPPAWVPASVMSYGHFSCDFGKVYAQVRELVVAEFGDAAKEGFKSVEQQIESAAKTDVPTLLSSLGTRHSVVSFPPKLTQGEAPAGGARALPFAVPMGRTGIVCQLKDEEPWKRLIQLGAGFAALSQGMVKPAEEQGFTGLRLNVQGIVEGGVFVGRGHLLLGIGPDVVEPLMASLRSPPQGDAALRSSPLLGRAAALLAPEPCIMYDVSDYNQYLKSMRMTIMTLLDAILSSGGPLGAPVRIEAPGDGQLPGEDKAEMEKAKAVVEKIKGLVPSEEELEGAMGVGVGQAVVSEHGLVYRMAIELPPPK